MEKNHLFSKRSRKISHQEENIERSLNSGDSKLVKRKLSNIMRK